jgi:hypothetical protein
MLIDFVSGAILGGLALSACWGMLWLIISTVGFARGTCRGRAVVNSLVVAAVPLLLAGALVWMRAEAATTSIALAIGVPLMPLVLMGLAVRPAPDGRPAGLHMLRQIRYLLEDLLGTHHACGGCGQDHGPDGGGGHV